MWSAAVSSWVVMAAACLAESCNSSLRKLQLNDENVDGVGVGGNEEKEGEKGGRRERGREDGWGSVRGSALYL